MGLQQVEIRCKIKAVLFDRAAVDAREAAACRAAINPLDPDAAEAWLVLERKLAETIRQARPFIPR